MWRITTLHRNLLTVSHPGNRIPEITVMVVPTALRKRARARDTLDLVSRHRSSSSNVEIRDRSSGIVYCGKANTEIGSYLERSPALGTPINCGWSRLVIPPCCLTPPVLSCYPTAFASYRRAAMLLAFTIVSERGQLATGLVLF